MEPLGWAHPRVCGENLATVRTPWAFSGSSPRVRGKLIFAAARCRGEGLIPACAGKTVLHQAWGYSSGAHPRVCGENFRLSRLRNSSGGSSPRVRGKLVPTGLLAGGSGLIPACAGKTKGLDMPESEEGAHPRVCGENPGLVRLWISASGSSPRVRGKLNSERTVLGQAGLIPACAGKTPS